MLIDGPSLFLYFFFFNDTATTEIYTLSLHDALPISPCRSRMLRAARLERGARDAVRVRRSERGARRRCGAGAVGGRLRPTAGHALALASAAGARRRAPAWARPPRRRGRTGPLPAALGTP